MTRRQRSRARVLLLAFCALFFAQWTMAAHACPLIKAAGEALEWQALIADDGGANCHQPPAEPLCVKHCNGDDQANGAVATPAAGAPPAPLVLRVAALERISPVTLSAATHADATAPPLTILYCVFLV